MCCWTPQLIRSRKRIHSTWWLLLSLFQRISVIAHFIFTLFLAYRLAYYYPGLTSCGVYQKVWWVCRGRPEEWKVVLMITIHPPPSISSATSLDHWSHLWCPQPQQQKAQQKGGSIGAIINRSEWGITEVPIDSHTISLQPMCHCILVINCWTLQDARTPACLQ